MMLKARYDGRYLSPAINMSEREGIMDTELTVLHIETAKPFTNSVAYVYADRDFNSGIFSPRGSLFQVPVKYLLFDVPEARHYD